VDNLSIIISALLAKTTEADIQTQLKKIENNLKPLDLKASLTSDIQNTEKQITSSLDKIERKFKAARSLGNLNISGNLRVADTSQLDKASQVYTQMEGKVAEITKKTNEWTNSTGETVKQIEHFKNGATEAYKKTTEITDNYKKLAETMAKVRERGNQTTQIDTIKDLQKQVDASNKVLEEESLNKIQKGKEASVSARKLIYEENQERLKTTTATQSNIEKTILSSNENIAQQQSRINKVNANSYEQTWNKLLSEDKIYSRNNLNTTIQSIEKENALIKQQIALYKEEWAIRNKNAQTTYGSKYYNSSAMSSIASDVSSLSATSIDELNSKTKQLNIATNSAVANMRAVRREATLTAKEADGFITTFGKDILKLGIWALAASAIYSPLRAIRSGVEYISEMDNALNEVRIVTNKTQTEVNGLAQSYNRLAKEMSVTTSELTKTVADLYRQGLGDSQVEERMKGIIEYAKISSISLEDSNRIITATANATGESVNKIIDIFALLGDTTASGADEIGDALTRVASAAENSNISLEKSASWLATISSITRESASTIGRSLNSAISRFESIKKTGFNEEDSTKLNDVVKSLHDVGINALDSQKQLRDFADVMDELGKNIDGTGSKFDKLSKNEKAYIATTMFGTFQRNRGLTLLTNYQDSLNNYENALNSAGTAEQKFGIYQESTAAKLDRAKASLEGFAQNAISSDTLKSAIDSFSALIEMIDKFVNSSSGSFLIQTVLISASLGLLKMAFTSLSSTAGVSGLITVFGRLLTSFKLLSTGASTLAFETTALRASFTALKISMASFLPTAVLVGLGLIIEMAIKAREQYKEYQETFEKSIKNFESNKSNLNSLQELSKQYDTLNGKVSKSAEEKEKLIEVQNAIGKSCSDLGIAYDEEGNAIIKNSKQIQEYIDLKKQQLELNRNTIVETYNSESNNKQKAIDDAQANLDKARSIYQENIANKQKYIDSGQTKFIKDYDKAIQDASARIQESQKVLITAKDANDALNLSLINSQKKFESLDSTIKNNLISTFNELKKVKTDLDFKTFLNDINVDKITAFSSAINKFQDTGDIKSLVNAFDELKQYYLDLSDGNEEFANSMMQTQDSIIYTKVAVYKFNEAMKLLSAQTVVSAGDIASAFNMLGISINSDVASIISGYTSLILKIKDVATAYAIASQIASDFTSKQTTYTPEERSRRKGSTNVQLLPTLTDYGAKLEALANNKSSISSSSGGGGGGSGSGKDAYETDQYSQALANLNAELETLSYNKSKLSQTSQEYRNILQQEIEVQKQIQDLAHAQADNYRAQIASGSLSQKEIDEAESSILSLGDTWRTAQEKIESINLDLVNSQLSTLANATTKVKTALDLVNSELSYLTPGTSAYNAKKQESITLSDKYIQQLALEQAAIRQLMLSANLSAAQLEELNNKLQDNINTLNQYKVTLLQQAASDADEAVSEAKSAIDEQKEAKLDAIEEESEALEEQHEQIMDQYDDQLDKIQEIINKELERLNETEDEYDFNKNLSNLQKEQQDIQTDINKYALDTSPEGVAKLVELKEELADKNAEIEDLQHDRSLELQKSALEQQLEDYQTDIEAKQEAEDEKYEALKEELDDEREEYEDYYNDLANDEQYWADMRQSIIDSSNAQITALFAQLGLNIDGTMTGIANSIDQNLIAKIQAGTATVEDLQNAINALNNEETTSYSDSSSSSSNSSSSISTQTPSSTGLDNTVIGSDGLTEYTRYMRNLVISGGSIPIYHDGGIVGEETGNSSKVTQLVNKLFNIKSGEMLAKLADGELVISKSNISNFLPNLQNLISTVSPQIAIAGSSPTITNTITFNVDGSNGLSKSDLKQAAEYVYKQINNSLIKKGT